MTTNDEEQLDIIRRLYEKEERELKEKLGQKKAKLKAAQALHPCPDFCPQPQAPHPLSDPHRLLHGARHPDRSRPQGPPHEGTRWLPGTGSGPGTVRFCSPSRSGLLSLTVWLSGLLLGSFSSGGILSSFSVSPIKSDGWACLRPVWTGRKGTFRPYQPPEPQPRGAVTRRAVAQRRSRAGGLTRPSAEAIRGFDSDFGLGFVVGPLARTAAVWRKVFFFSSLPIRKVLVLPFREGR